MGPTVMPTYVTYRCEEISCRKKFPWDPSDGFPKVCPHCGYEPEAPDDNVIALPAILSQKTRVADDVAKRTMDGSSERALIAAQATGESLADMNAMKLTNMTDSGSVPETPNEVSKFMQQHNVGGFAGTPPTPAAVEEHTKTAMQLAAQAHTGPDARAGARAMGSLQKALFNIK